jgi:hypothetical protein
MKTINIFFFGILFIANVAGAETAQMPTAGHSSKSVLSQILGKTLYCTKYSAEYGNLELLNNDCVNVVVESTLLAIKLTNNPQSFASFETTVKNIQSCPLYNLRYGIDTPYRGDCVVRAVELAQSILTQSH